MATTMSKFLFCIILITGISKGFSQQGNFTNVAPQTNQAFGNLNNAPSQLGNLSSNNMNDNNANPINNFDNNPPIQQQQLVQEQVQEQVQTVNKNIEPSLGNGFHLRFQVNSEPSVETRASLSHTGFIKSKKSRSTFAKVNFRMKIKMRNAFSKHKKSYNTSLCCRF